MASANIPARRVLALCGAFVVVLGVVVLFKWNASHGASAAERACHLLTWNRKTSLVWLQLESGSIAEVANTTACVVLDEIPSKTLVRITEGPYKGMTGWVSGDAVGR